MGTRGTVIPRNFITKTIEGHIMKLPRRRFLHLAASAATMPAVSRVAKAQAYPAKPVRIVVGFPPGGNADLYARLIGQWLSEQIGQQFFVENRSGAGGSLATEFVARAAPDGYTILLSGSNDAWNTALYDNLKFDYLRDIAPIASLVRAMGVLVVNPSFPTRSVTEFIAYAKRNPGKISVGSGGVGSGSHLYWALFDRLTGGGTVNVPYRGGGPALTDLLGDQVQAAFPNIVSAIEYIRAGQLRALAVTGAMRAGVLPEIPALGEFITGYEATGWVCVSGPRNTPAAVVDRLNREINASLADPRLKQRIADLGDEVFVSSPAEFKTYLAEYTEKWTKVIHAAGIRAG
jgi:tripartite-type tricarboxylate transporter receptor subunit TctC